MPLADPFADPPGRVPSASIDAPEPVWGPLETAVRGDIDALTLVTPTARSMAELAYNLARKLDSGAGMATAAVASELRATLKEMAEQAGDDDGAELLRRLSSPDGVSPAVRDAPQP